MSSLVIFAGIMGYGIYKYCNKTSKYRSNSDNDFSQKREKFPDDLLGKVKLVGEESENVDELLYAGKVTFNDLASMFKIANKSVAESVDFLKKINILLYKRLGKTSAGFFVTEKNLSSGMDFSQPKYFTVSSTIESFIVPTCNGKVFFFKNEFYENEQSGETLCMSTSIEEVVATVVGCGYTASNKLFGVGYQNGIIITFYIHDLQRIIVNQRFQLNVSDMIHFSIAFQAPIVITIDNKYEKKFWNMLLDGTILCLDTVSLAEYFAKEKTVFLGGGVLEVINEKHRVFPFFFAVNDVVDRVINIYVSILEAEPAERIKPAGKIPYEGEVVCASFNAQEGYFVFYLQGGENQGVHVFSLDDEQLVAHFTPHDKQQQHPVAVTVTKDKVWCIYQDGLMDMWHCDLDRLSLAANTFDQIVSALPLALRVDFLEQFGLYMLRQTPENYDMVVALGSRGLHEDTIKALLFRLQFLDSRLF